MSHAAILFRHATA